MEGLIQKEVPKHRADALTGRLALALGASSMSEAYSNNQIPVVFHILSCISCVTSTCPVIF